MIIDIHSHVAHPRLLAKYPMPPSLGDIVRLIEVKAAAGITTTIVGSPTGAAAMAPVPGLDTFAQEPGELRAFHAWLAATVREHRSHLRAYVWCNAFGDDAELTAAAEALRDDAFVGLIANTSVRGEYLDSPKADGFFAMAAEQGVPVLLHPGSGPAAAHGVQDYGLVEMVGRHCDVTMGLAAIVLSGRLEQHPGLKLIAASSGGALGLLPGRLDLAWRPRHWDAAGGPAGAKPPPPGLHRAPRTQAPPSELLRRVYVDTTAEGPFPLAFNLETFGPERIVFGTDAPPVPVDHREKVAAVEALPLTPEQRAAVLHRTAAELFGLHEPGGPFTGPGARSTRPHGHSAGPAGRGEPADPGAGEPREPSTGPREPRPRTSQPTGGTS
ncbi:amidohydrolase family protein [Streptomyces sp. NPDC001889]